MTKKIPQYLKLHVEDDALAACPRPTDVHGLGQLCHEFEQLTGWQMGIACGSTNDTNCRWSMDLTGPDTEPARLTLDPVQPDADALPLNEAQPLAQAIGQLLAELQRTRQIVWQREAELATAIPVTIRKNDQQQLASGLEAVLRGGAKAIGCQAAALYLLDDATSLLKLRACWGLSKTRFLEPPRPLRGAVSDLEALVGHAVALEDTSLLPHWKVPEDYPAALCVPVASTNTPLGTLWFFADRIREFTEVQTNVAEIIAGRLVADLEREVLLRSGYASRKDNRMAKMVASRQNDHLPRLAPLVDGWQVAGKTKRGQMLGGDLFDWSVLPDGRLAVALGHAQGSPLDRALTATTLHTAIKSHGVHPHDARQMLEWLNETIWSSSTGDRFASLFYGVIDPEGGTLRYANAGRVRALIYGPQRCSTLSADTAQLGGGPDSQFSLITKRITPQQTLVLFSPGLASQLQPADGESSETCLTAKLRTLVKPTAEEQVNAILDAAADQGTSDASLVAVRRLF